MTLHVAVVLELVLATSVFGDVVSSEFTSAPEREGWDIIQIYCEPKLWLEDGWFFQHVELCPGERPPGGQAAAYRRSLADFIGEDQLFIEWVVESDAERSFPVAVRKLAPPVAGVESLVLLVGDGPFAQIERIDRFFF